MNIKKLLGKKLQDIRKHKKITQERLAEIVGVDTSSISNIENGKYYPSAENLDKIIETLGVMPHEIFLFESNASPDDLMNEMVTAMKNDKSLIKLMYKFYLSVKY